MDVRMLAMPSRGRVFSAPSVGVSGRRPGAIIVTTAVQEDDSPKGRDKGWFFNTFVKDRFYENRRANMIVESAARKGQVDTLFDNAFKYTAWLEVHRVLMEAGQKSITAEEALKMKRNRNAVLLDVREPQDFAEGNAEGSVNVPLFRLIQGSDLRANARRLGFALLTNFSGTERNPEFAAQALALVGGDKRRPVIVMCALGGSLDYTVEKKGRKFVPPERTFGRQTRSLKACYELRQAGFTNVYHLKGGLNQWFYDGFP